MTECVAARLSKIDQPAGHTVGELEHLGNGAAIKGACERDRQERDIPRDKSAEFLGLSTSRELHFSICSKRLAIYGS
jgi:hypothetical protein